MMQTHTRHSQRLSDHIEGPVARGKREHRQELRKFWLSLGRAAFIAAVLVTVAYLLGVDAK